MAQCLTNRLLECGGSRTLSNNELVPIMEYLFVIGSINKKSVATKD